MRQRGLGNGKIVSRVKRRVGCLRCRSEGLDKGG